MIHLVSACVSFWVFEAVGMSSDSGGGRGGDRQLCATTAPVESAVSSLTQEGAASDESDAGSALAWFSGCDVDEQLDFVAVGIVHVHPLAVAVVQLEKDHDARSFEFALDGIELVE